MSDTNTSSEVSNNLYNNYKYTDGETIKTAFFPLDIDITKLNQVNPNGTSGIIVVDDNLAQIIGSNDLLVGMVAMPLAPITPEIEKAINKRAKASGGIEKGEGGVVALNAKQAERNRTAGIEK